MGIVAIIQARMGSTRLPSKVLMEVSGKPMLEQLVTRVLRAKTLDEIVIATSTEHLDNAIACLCEQKGWACFRGSHEDLLDRYHQTATKFGASVIVRLTADNPLVDPTLIDIAVNTFTRNPKVDYLSNCHPTRTYPYGLEVEVFHFSCLERALKLASKPLWREHVTPFFYQSPEEFTCFTIHWCEDLSHFRLTVDTREDLLLIQNIFGYFGETHFGWGEVIEVLKERPDWRRINANVVHKQMA